MLGLRRLWADKISALWWTKLSNFLEEILLPFKWESWRRDDGRKVILGRLPALVLEEIYLSFWTGDGVFDNHTAWFRVSEYQMVHGFNPFKGCSSVGGIKELSPIISRYQHLTILGPHQLGVVDDS